MMQKDVSTTTPPLRAALPLRAVLWRWRGYLAALGLLLLPLAVFLQPALLQRVFFKHDVQHYFYPYHLLSARLVAQGQLPLWNRYAFSGIPLLGDGQTALFYPPNWLFFVLPGAAALNYDLLIQFSIAGLGFFLYARSLGLWRLPALVGAIAYMFGGFMTARVVHLSILSSAALIPLLFFCVEQVLRTQTLRWFVAAAGAVALQTLAGHPQVPVYTALALGLYALIRAVERWATSGQRRWLVALPVQLAGVYILGYGLAAVQLVPWVELARLSPRAASASFDFVFNGSMHGSEWLLFVFPYLYGSLAPGPYAAQQVDINAAINIWEHSAYVGILPLALAAIGLLGLVRFPRRPTTDDRRPTTDASPPRFLSLSKGRAGDRRPFGPKDTPSSGQATTDDHYTQAQSSVVSGQWSVVGGRWSVDSRRWFSSYYFALLLLLSLVMAAGKYSPVADLIYATPVIGKLREIDRAIVLVAFALTMLAAIGMQRLIETPVVPQKRMSRISLLVVAAATVLIPLCVVLFARQLAVRVGMDLQPKEVENLALQRPNAFVPLALSCASAALLVWWSRRPPGAPAQAFAVGLVLIDMAVYAAGFNPTTDPQIYQRDPDVLAVFRADRTLFRKATFLTDNDPDNRTAQETLAVSWGMVYGIEDINGFNSLQPRRYTDYLFGPNVEDVSYGYLMNERLLQPESPVLSALNVKYLLVRVGREPHSIGRTFRQVYANDRVRVYENTQVYPRAYFVETVRSERDPSVVLRTVTAAGFDGRRVALIEAAQPPALRPTSAAAAPATVSFANDTPNQITLATSTAESRFLVLSEMYFPGWRAYVDGVETPIYQTNYLFRGVVVPPGQHTLVFAYRPTSVLVGAAISLVALLLAAGLLIVGRRYG
jgi:Bacterial membrane protein YfhO